MTIHEWKRIRKRLGLTQGALAKRLGVTLTTVGRWECGIHPIPDLAANFVRQIAKNGGKP